MSGIAAACKLHDELDPELLRKMASRVSHRGPHGEGLWTSGGVGLASHLLRTTPESATEEGITVDEKTGCRVIWDGRLDNREEILSGIEGGSRFRTSPDTVLVLAAYREWGTDCLKKMIGDFAFVLWDAKRQELFAGRDRIGVKPFYYLWDGGAFYMASEAKPLFEALGKIPQPDDEMPLAFLNYRNFREADHHRTFFAGIHRLPPAHYLLVSEGGLSIHRYGSFDLTRTLKLSSEEEYLERFRALFQEAVRSRMRSIKPISFHLSGGLDSSAVVCMSGVIARERRENPAVHQDINLYSDDALFDERVYARQAARLSDVNLHELFSRTPDPLKGLDEFLWEAEAPHVSVSRNREPYEFLRDRNIDVVLAGDGGDQLLDENGFLGDLLSRMKIFRYLATVYRYSEYLGESLKNPEGLAKEMWYLTKDILPEILPAPVLRRIRKVLKSVPQPWINPLTARKFGLEERFLTPDKNPPFSSYGQLLSYKSITEPYFVSKLEVEERAHGLYGIEIRYPMLDSRLAEFVLSIPWQMRVTGERKRLVRRALSDLLPENVLRRKDKGSSTGDADEGIVRACRAPQPEPARNHSGLIERYVSLDKVKNLVERYLRVNRRIRFEIWFLITVDHWLKQFKGGRLDERPEKEETLSFAESR